MRGRELPRIGRSVAVALRGRLSRPFLNGDGRAELKGHHRFRRNFGSRAAHGRACAASDQRPDDRPLAATGDGADGRAGPGPDADLLRVTVLWSRLAADR